jgi:WD40 repeat protein
MPMCPLWDGQTAKSVGIPCLRSPRSQGWIWILHGLIFEGHTDTVTSVAFSPDGRSIVSGSGDNTMCVWDASTGTERYTMHGRHEGWVTSVTFSPDGQFIVSGSDDNTVRVWDATTGAERYTMHGHENEINYVAFSPNGQLIVSGSDDRTVRMWDASKGTERYTHGHEGRVYSVAFLPNGQFIVSHSDGNTVRVWDVTTGTEQHTRPDLNLSPAARAPHTVVAFQADDITGWVWRVGPSGTRQQLCWLPRQYRGKKFAFHGQTVCIGAPSGAITILDFSDVPFSYE